MYFKRNILLLLFFIAGFQSFAQKAITLKGVVKSKKNQGAIESATVYLQKVKDSTMVDYTITDKNGAFNLKTSPVEEEVYLKISYLRFKDYAKKYTQITTDLDLQIVELEEEEQLIEAVVIKSDIPPIRIKKDTLEFNASSFKMKPDANVESLLKQLPGVEIGADGKISVNGKEVNQILVNGKPFFDKDGKVALQNLPSSMINKVQVTDTKTKKEEKTGQTASSNNASINLTIDEKKNKGFFGKIIAGTGSDKRYETSGIANYFKNKTKVSVLTSANNVNSVGFSMDEVFDNMGGGRNGNKLWLGNNGSFWYGGQNFGSENGITESNLAGINYSDTYFKNFDFSSSFFHSSTHNRNVNKTNYTNLLPTGTFETKSNSITTTDSNYNNFDFTSDIKIDSTFSIVLEPKFNKSVRNNWSQSVSSSYENNVLLNDISSENRTQSENSSFSNTTTITKNFNSKGRSLSIVINNEHRKEDYDNLVNSTTNFYLNSNPSDIRNQSSNSKTTNNLIKGELEFQEPIMDSLTVSLGTSFEYNTFKNDNKTFDFDEFSNSYVDENDRLTLLVQSKTSEIYTYAGVIFMKSKLNLFANLGTLSIHNVNESGYLGIDSRIDKNFMLPKANFNINYKFTKSKSVWVNYDLKYDMPSAVQIIPIENLSNPLNTVVGNPDLNINKMHSVYLSFRNFDYTTRSGYGLYSGINYNENQVTSKATFDENRKRTTTYVNISGTNNAWFGLYWNKSIKKDNKNYRLELRVNNNLGYDKGFVNNDNYTSSSFTISPTAKFTYENTDKFSITPSYNFSKNFVNYTNYTLDKTNFYTHKLNLQVTTFWPKNWTFGNDFGYNYNSNLGSGFRNDFYLWNTSLSYSFYKDTFLAKVKVYDVLNQNLSTRRTVTETSIIDQENIVLKRYIMFSLTYKVKMFDSKNKKESKRYIMM